MVSTVHTFVKELVAKVKGNAPALASGSNPPNHVINLSLVKVQCADMFSAVCSFAAVLIAKLKGKGPLNPVPEYFTRAPAPAFVRFPLKKKFLKLVMRSNNPPQRGETGDNGRGRGY